MMNSINDRNSRNDKIMDIILEAATEQYAEDVANEPVDCDMSDDEKQNMLEQKDRIYRQLKKEIKKARRPRRFSLKKTAVAAAALAVAVGVTANVSAFRTFLYKTYTDMSGTFLNITIKKVPDEAYNAITRFRNKDEIIIPDWLPPGMTLTDIDDHEVGISLEYKSDEFWMTIDENILSDDGPSIFIETENNEYEVYKQKIMDMDAVVVDTTSEIGLRVISVTWNSDNTWYDLTTNATGQTFETIVESLKYLN